MCCSFVMRLISTIISIILLLLLLFIMFWFFQSKNNNNDLKPNDMSQAQQNISQAIVNNNNYRVFRDQCDEHYLILELSELNIISPEKILFLITNSNLHATCLDIKSALLDSVTNTTSVLPKENLYRKLLTGLEYFYSFVCVENDEFRKKDLKRYRMCIQDLSEEISECDGSPDWFENENNSEVCKTFEEIVQCQHKAIASYCGHKAAQIIRNLSTEITQRILMNKCSVTRSLREVDVNANQTAAASAAPLIGRRFYFFVFW